MNTKNKSIDDALEKILVSAGFLGASQTLHGTPECMMAAMRAALTAAVAELAPVGAVPTGWKTVPVESTPEMRAAAMSCGKTSSKEEYYCAMLSAAPQPPETVSTAPAGKLSDEQIDALHKIAINECAVQLRLDSIDLRTDTQANSTFRRILARVIEHASVLRQSKS